MPDQLSLDWTLDPREARVLALLRVRRGRGQAIRVPDLAALVQGGRGESGTRRRGDGLSPREVQDVVKRLREQHGCPILSAAARPAGYYWADTIEELEACIREQRRKAISTIVMLRALRRHRAWLLGQLQMRNADCGMGNDGEAA